MVKFDKTVSPKMKKAVKIIKDILHVEPPSGKHDDVSKFIEENLDKAFSSSNYTMTEKQSKCIKAIESKLGVKFEGSSAKDVSDFISAHIESLKSINIKSTHKSAYNKRR